MDHLLLTMNRLIMHLIFGDLMKALWLFLQAIISISLGTIPTESAFCQASGFFVQFGTEVSGKLEREQHPRHLLTLCRRLCCALHCCAQCVASVPTIEHSPLGRPVPLPALCAFRCHCSSRYHGLPGVHQSAMGLHVAGTLLLASVATVLVSTGAAMDPPLSDYYSHHRPRSCDLCSCWLSVSRVVGFNERDQTVRFNLDPYAVCR